MNKRCIADSMLAAAVLAVPQSVCADPAQAAGVVPAPLALTLEVVPAQPLPGQQLYWLARLRNSSARPVYIPLVTLDWLQVTASFLLPEATGAVGLGEVVREVQAPLQWQLLAPGEVLEKAGTVGAAVPACRSGCPAGTVALSASFGSARGAGLDGLAADHIVPSKMSVSKAIHVAPPAMAVVPVIERRARTAVQLTVIGVRTLAGNLKARVELENRSGQPLWMRKLEKMVAYCDFEGQSVGRPGSSAPTLWDGEDLVLVQPGRTLKGEVECGANQPTARSVKVTLTPTEWAVLQRQHALEPPFVWMGSTQSEAFAFGPRPNR